MGVAPHADELAASLATVARALMAEEGVQHTLDRMVVLAVEIIESCQHAAVSLTNGRVISTAAASDDVARRIDEIQYATDQGPCLDTIREDMVCQVDDLATDSRWPAFAAAAVEQTGVRGMLAVRLFEGSDTLGALNLFSGEVDAFRADSEAGEIAAVFAAHAAVALSAAEHEENLHKALASRDVIGQAKGILMARESVTSEEAFAMLTRASQRLNAKLRDVAEDLAVTGELPAPRLR